MSQNDRKEAASIHDESIATNDEFPIQEVEEFDVTKHADTLDPHPNNINRTGKIFRGNPRAEEEWIMASGEKVVNLEDWE